MHASLTASQKGSLLIEEEKNEEKIMVEEQTISNRLDTLDDEMGNVRLDTPTQTEKGKIIGIKN